MEDEREFSPGGSEIFRHEAPEEPPPITTDAPVLEAVQEHVERHLGEIAGVYHEVISPHVHLDVLQVDPFEDRPFTTLITCGMSALPMSVPEEFDAPRHVELVLTVPAEWRLTEEDFSDERWYWPIRLLKTVGRLPHEYGTWVGVGHTIPNEEPPQPYAPDTEVCGAILLPPQMIPDGMVVLERQDGDPIHFLAVVPLYAHEMDLKLEHGTGALVDAWEDAGIPTREVVDPQRPPLPAG
jgi:hypothetical protein